MHHIYISYIIYLIFRHIQMGKLRGIEHEKRNADRVVTSKALALNQQLEITFVHGKLRDFCLPSVLKCIQYYEFRCVG